MISETTAFQLAATFSSFGIIYFIYFYFSKIQGFSIKGEASKHLQNSKLSESADLEEKLINEDENSPKLKLTEEIELLDKVRRQISSENRLFFFITTSFISGFGLILFGLIAAFLEEYRGSFYISIAFAIGLAFSITCHFCCLELGDVSSYIMILKLNQKVSELFSFGFYAGFSIISLFLGGVSLILMAIIDIYRSYYIDNRNHSLKDYEKMMFLATGGFSLGYFLAAMFYRVGGGIFQSSVNITADLIGKIDKSLPPEEFTNPCSLINRVADLQSSFLQNFSDISSLILLSFTSVLIFLTQSAEFMKTKEAIYFPMVLLASNIVITFMSYFIINYFEFLPNEESPRYARNQVILQMIITSVLMFIVCYELSSTFFSEEFSFFVDESKDTTSFKTLKNLEKKKAKPELITICVILGYFAEKIFIFSFEFFSSSNGAPSKALIRSCETGPCFNLITANVINSIVYPIIIIIVAGLFFAGYGILGYFGISLMALGALSNIVMIYSINMIGDLGNNSYRLTALTKFNENSKEKLFNMSWYPHNYKAFLRGVEFLVLILAGFAIAGNFICFLNDFNLIILKSLQSFGLILGFVVPYLLNGIVICEVQYVTNHIMRLAKIAMYNAHNIKTISQKTHLSQEIISAEIAIKSLLYVCLPNTLNFSIIFLLGLAFGPEIIFTYQMAFIMSSSFLVSQSFIAGYALDNSKKYMENNAYIEKEGSVYASISIGQTHSMSFKENSLSLLHYICMNAVLCLLAANSFEKYGNIAVSLGLKIVSK